MSQGRATGIGIDRDRVTLTLAGDEVLDAESYEIAVGLISQPGAFALRLGNGAAVQALIQKYPARTPFTLAVEGAVIMRGFTDGFTVSDGGGASEVTIRGRDGLAPLHDDYLESEQSFAEISYVDLTRKALDETVGKGAYTLIPSNDANRKAVTGSVDPPETTVDEVPSTAVSEEFHNLAYSRTTTARISTAMRTSGWAAADTLGQAAEKALEKAANASQTLFAAADAAAGGSSQPNGVPSGPSPRTIQGKLGEKWYAGLLKPHLDRAGLFIWQAGGIPTGLTFVLSDPNIAQAPLCRLFRKRPKGGGIAGQSNVLSAQYKNETTQRFANCKVHFRRGGGSEARGKGYGLFVDQEMTALGFTHSLVIKDDRCKSLLEADLMAKRKICEVNRNAWILEYTVAGHSTPWIGGGQHWVVWYFDTIVEVDDDEYGIHDTFYVESISMRGNPQKTTTLRLMRTSDALFGDIDGQ